MNTCPHKPELHELRPDLTALPERIKQLPIDKRGYPVPWFVQWIDGEPDFRVMDSDKWVQAVKQKLCWVCGQPLGSYKAFVIGPMCAINRTTSEPPNHLECAHWSVLNCPFLTQRQIKYREDELTKQAKSNVAGILIERQPGVAMIWVTRSFKVFLDDKGRPLINIGDPVSHEWWSHGRAATRAEVVESVDTGLPFLVPLAEAEGPEAVAELDRRRAVVRLMYPA